MKKKNRFLTFLLAVQGIYSLLTALWGLIDIESFMAVTGPKTDIWLVKTVSVLIIPISLCLLSYLFIEMNLVPAIVTGLTSAIGLAIIDFYYSSTDVIWDIYQVDGVVQVLFIVGWIAILFQQMTGVKNNERKV